jgi:hypothetical protein
VTCKIKEELKKIDYESCKSDEITQVTGLYKIQIKEDMRIEQEMHNARCKMNGDIKTNEVIQDASLLRHSSRFLDM